MQVVDPQFPLPRHLVGWLTVEEQQHFCLDAWRYNALVGKGIWACTSLSWGSRRQMASPVPHLNSALSGSTMPALPLTSPACGHAVGSSVVGWWWWPRKLGAPCQLSASGYDL